MNHDLITVVNYDPCLLITVVNYSIEIMNHDIITIVNYDFKSFTLETWPRCEGRRWWRHGSFPAPDGLSSNLQSKVLICQFMTFYILGSVLTIE